MREFRSSRSKWETLPEGRCIVKRNRHLVDYSSACICYLNKSTGGTAYTVEYAKKRGLQIINLAEK